MSNLCIIKKYSLSKQLADTIEEKIENGTYPVGTKIPTEAELIEKYKVSRNTVREAIRHLVDIGLVIIRQGDGTYVRAANRYSANLLIKCDELTPEEIKEARNTLEVTIASLAAKRRTAEDLENLKKAFERRTNSKSMSKENTIADAKFHLEIARASHNNLLFDLYNSLFEVLISHIEKVQQIICYNDVEIDKLHEDLYKAIVEGNQEAASKAALKILTY